MLWNRIRKDIRRNKVINITLTLFLILSAFLMASGSQTVMQMMNSMNRMFEIAKPPHFLQMHTGEIDQQAIDEFAASQDYVQAEETIKMLNINSASIWYEREHCKEEPMVSMSDNMMDNGFVTQTKSLDYLLDLNNEIVHLQEGEIGVPISYIKTYELQVGDKLIIKEGDFQKEFDIVCFVRDAQMASTMASSTRFLVADEDWKQLSEHLGELEYIIEFRFDESSEAGKFSKLYSNPDSGMPINGQAITYPMIVLINGLSGGMLAGMMILVSILLIFVAVINLRFTILATMEEERKEIGTMKAIGFSKKDVRDYYLTKYRVFAVVGCIVGYLFALTINQMLTKSIALMFGEQKMNFVERLLPIVATMIVYLLVIHFCKKILKRLDKITIVETLVYEEEKKDSNKSRILPLKKMKCKNVNGFLGIRELLVKRKFFMILVVTFLVATCILIIPINLLHTLESPKFIETMGIAKSDVQIYLNVKDDLQERYESITEALSQDPDIKEYVPFASCQFGVYGKDGLEPFRIDCGDYSRFQITYMEGRSPENSGEIALASMNAQSLDVSVGDTLKMQIHGEDTSLTVCGIYQDITSGGYTAKSMINYEQDDVMAYNLCVNLNNKDTIPEFVERYTESFPYAKPMPMEAYSMQTFGTITDSFQGVVVVTYLIGIGIAILITILVLKLLSVKEYAQCATMKALGFTSMELQKQYLLEVIIAAGIGIAAGVLVAGTLGEKIVGFILELTGMGLSSFKFIPNVPVTFLLCPLSLIVVSILVTWLSQREIKHINIIEMIRE